MTKCVAHTEMCMSGKDPLSPILAADRLHAVAAEGHRHNLDDNYCIYCAERLTAGDWQFVCDGCQEPVARGEYNIPAAWIGELFIDVYGKTNNTMRFVRRRNFSVDRGQVY